MDIRGKAFTPCINQIQELSGRRQSASAFPRRGNRMSCLAVKFHEIAPQAQRVHIGPALASRPAVHHHGQGHIVKDALGGHTYLRTVLLLRGGADHMQLSFIGILQILKCKSRQYGE